MVSQSVEWPISTDANSDVVIFAGHEGIRSIQLVAILLAGGSGVHLVSVFLADLKTEIINVIDKLILVFVF